MSFPYLCPHCRTNRSRFNLIEQVVQPVKKDHETGELIEYLAPDDPLQFKYNGEDLRVQCGVCGMVEAERLFIQQAHLHPL